MYLLINLLVSPPHRKKIGRKYQWITLRMSFSASQTFPEKTHRGTGFPPGCFPHVL